jgi:cell division protease FtsH
MDQEVRELVDNVYKRTEKLLTDNYGAFDRIAQLLLEKEVIMSDDLEDILGPKVTA